MLTLPFSLDLDAAPQREAPRALAEILMTERRLLAQELVQVFEYLSASIGREAAVRDSRVRRAARRYRMFCGAPR